MQDIFKLTKPNEYRKAGRTDLIEMLPVQGNVPYIPTKEKIEVVAYSIVDAAFLHISGPTGSGKSLLLESLAVPGNFAAICEIYGFPKKDLKIHYIEMVQFESSSELYARRAIKSGTTFDEESTIITALRDASEHKEFYHVIWLREIGRCHSAAVQSGLLNLMTKRSIPLRNEVIHAPDVCWIADSNYMAMQDSIFNLVVLDDAIRRRFAVNMTLEYLSFDQEVSVLHHLVRRDPKLAGKADDDLIFKVVDLGTTIRRFRTEGKLQSIVAPTIYGYLAFIRMASVLKSWTPQEIAKITLLGNATLEDSKEIPGVFAETKSFGFYIEDDEEEIAGVQF